MPVQATWTPPDGGWGWVIAVCSLLLHAQTLGVMLTMSVMYVSWLEAFEEGRGATSWIISIGVAVMFGLGPLPAALANRYGFRLVVILSGLLTSAGYILSYFATSVSFLIASIGIVTGLGCCFGYLSAVAVVSIYFNKRRSVAMGIAVSGVGIGSMVAAPVVNILIETYGWRGALLITGAASLNICVYGLLLRPLENTEVMRGEETIIDCDRSPQKTNGIDQEKASLISYDDNGTAVQEVGKVDSNNYLQKKHMLKEDAYDSSLTLNSVDSFSVKKVSDIARSRLSMLLRSGQSPSEHAHPFSSLKDISRNKKSMDRLVPLPYVNWKNSMDALFATSVKQVNGSISLILAVQNDEAADDVIKNGFDVQIEQVDSRSFQDNGNEDSSTGKKQGCCSSYKEGVMEILRRNREILRDPIFLQFAISNIITNLSYITPTIYLVDRAVDSGLEKDVAAMLIALTGIGGIFGRICFGAITYRLFPDRLVTYIVVLVLAGASTMISPLCGSSVSLHCIYATLIGCFIGGYATLVAVVTVDIMGLAKASESFGLLLTFMGAATLIGPPFAGILFDWTRTYLFSYVLFGLFLVISALMLLPTALKRRRRMQREEKVERAELDN